MIIKESILLFTKYTYGLHLKLIYDYDGLITIIYLHKKIFYTCSLISFKISKIDLNCHGFRTE